MEFSDCSIAAADLSMVAKNKIEETDEVRNGVYVLGDYLTADSDTPQKLAYQTIISRLEDIGQFNFSSRLFSLNGHSSELVLMQPYGVVEKPVLKTRETKTGRWILGRTTEIEEYTEVHKTEELIDEPILAVEVGNGTFLPIASFALRTNGNCSYVQLGREMKDDNYYTTTADDRSPRQALVEALRAFVKGKISKNQQQTIQRFIDEQAEAHRAELATAYEQQLAAEAINAVKVASIEKLTVLRGGENRPAPDNYHMRQLTAPLILPDGRLVELALITEQTDKQDYAELVAITRASLAVPLARFADLYKNAEFTIEMDQPEREKLIRDLLFAVIRRPNLDESASPLSHFIHSYVQAVGMDPHAPKGKIYGGDHFKQCSLYFAYPDGRAEDLLKLWLGEGYREDAVEEATQEIAERLEILRGRADQLAKQLNLQEHLAQLLGPARACDERFMYFVDWLANTKGRYQAVFENMTVSSTISDTLVSAEVTREDHAFLLKFAGRPMSMPHEPMRDLGEVWIDPTQPFLGHKDDKDSLFNPSNVEEWTDHLAQIIASQEQPLTPPPLWRHF